MEIKSKKEWRLRVDEKVEGAKSEEGRGGKYRGGKNG